MFDGRYSYDGSGPHPVHDVLTNFVGTGHLLRLRIQETPESGYNDNTFVVDNFSVTAVPAVAVTPPTGMVAWWPMNGSVTDVVGGIVPLATNALSFVPGEVGLGVTFSTNGYIDLPAPPQLESQQFTWEAWVRWDGTGPTEDVLGSVILQKAIYPSGQADYGLYARARDHAFLFECGNENSALIVVSNSLASGVFYHVAGSYDGATFKIYINGTLQKQIASGTSISSASAWTIGANAPKYQTNGFPRTWNGVIDEVSIYNRALGSNEISAIYNAGPAGKISSQPYFVTATNLPNGLTGIPYSQTITASVTTGNTFSLIGGSLPAGLNLSTNGLISGTPATVGTNSFTILATSSLGQTNSQAFVLAVFAPPVISAQPPVETVTNGSPAFLAVGVSGTAPLFYHWQKNGTNLTDGRIISGSATSALSLFSATTADAGNYSVIVTNAYGSVTSSVVALTVITATNQFNISLPLTTSSTNKLDLGLFSGGQVIQLSFVGNGDLVNSNLQTLPDGSLFASAGSPFGFANPGSSYPTVAGGDGVNHYPGGGLAYDATGSGFPFAGKLTTDTTDPAGIRDGAVVGTFNPSPANTNWFYIGYGGTFTVPAGGAHLYVAVNDSASSDNHGVYLGAINALVPSFSTTNLLLNPGAETGTLTNWTVGGSSNPFAGSPSNSLGDNFPTHSGNYYFVGGTGTYGSLSQTVSLIGNQGITAAMIDNSNLAASISFWEQGLDQSAPVDDDANITVAFFGASSNLLTTVITPVIDSHNLSWSNYANQYAIPSGTRFIQYTMNFYLHQGVGLDAFIDDNYLSVVQPVSVVPSSPVIASQPLSLTVTNGNPASFGVTASGSAPLSYQWQFDGTNLPNGILVSGATTNNLVLNSATTNYAGSYSVVITNAYGSVTSSVALLTVIPAGSSTTNGASFTVLHTFSALAGGGLVGAAANADGANPYAGVIVSGGRIYGVAELGGASGFGTIFAMDTNGANFTNLYTLGHSGGLYPVGDLSLDGSGMLYGTTSSDATNGDGTVFAANTNGSGYSIVHQFGSVANDGKTPMAGLYLGYGGLLYGTTEYGGSNNLGTVFVVNENGSGFTVLHHFASGEGSPSSGLSLSGNTLYGSAVNGGNFSQGTLFAVNTNGTGFTNFYSFTGGGDGGSPRGRLLVLNNMLFGTTTSGGTNSSGTVFAFNPSSNSLQVLHTFSITNFADGAAPLAGLVGSANSNTLYGTTSSGGTNVAGTIFSINTDGSGFATLHDFVSLTDGSVPSSMLALSGNTLYGTALEGGTNGEGTVFALTGSTNGSGLTFNLTVQLLGRRRCKSFLRSCRAAVLV